MNLIVRVLPGLWLALLAAWSTTVMAAGDTSRVQALIQQGEQNRVSGNILAAETAFRMAISVAQPDSLAQDYAYTALGVLQANEGLAQAKDTLLAEALGYGRAFGTEPLEHPFQVVALAHLAKIIAEDPRQVDDAAIYAARAAGAARLPLMRALAHSVLAEVEARRGRFDQAVSSFQDALSSLAASPTGHSRHSMALSLAEAMLGRADRTPQLLDPISRALSEAEAADSPALRAEALFLRAKAARIRGQSPAALDLTERAMGLAQAQGNQRLLFRVARQRAEIALANGDTRLADAAFRAAFANLQTLRTQMFIGFDRTGESIYRREAGNFHKTYMRFLLDRTQASGATSPAPDRIAQRRLEQVINVAEDLKAIEMEEYFRAECRRSSTTIDLAQTRGSRFTDDTAILYPIVFDQQVEVLVIHAGTIRRMPPTRIALDALRAKVASARSGLEDTKSAYAPALQGLFDTVFAQVFNWQPLRDKTVRNIVYIADGPLRNVPLAALMNGDRFLLEDYAVSSLLGITLNVSDGPRKNSRPFQPDRAVAMIAGASTTPEVSGKWQLQSVSDEVNQISALFDALGRDGDAYLGDQFAAVDPVRRAMQSKPYDVIHISAHAWFDGSSVNALGGGGYIGLKDASMSVGAFVQALLERGARYPDRRVELVVLSACGTASDGTDRAPLGIAGAAYRANVATIVATLWPVFDLSADRISRKFYLNLLQEGMGRAEALRQAQLWFLNSLARNKAPGWEADGWDHPAFWAPFILVGEPGFARASR